MSLVGLTKRTPVAETTVLSVSVANSRVKHCSIMLLVVSRYNYVYLQVVNSNTQYSYMWILLQYYKHMQFIDIVIVQLVVDKCSIAQFYREA